MLGIVMKIALVFSTIAPIGLTLSFLLFKSEKGAVWGFSALLISSVLCWICQKIIELSAKKLNRTTITVASTKPADKEISGYFVAYMIPVLGVGEYFLDLENLAFLAIMFFVFIWVSKSFYANPVLALCGYSFYEIQLTNGASLLLITKRQIRKPSEIDRVSYITSHTILDAP
ncbi:hypothetical protein [Pseudomonas coronafaciens]|uniref:hypothetical protein n=1 Tax=Pseudomonas coronafaciens TaxID=53409 RepID=UPI00177FCE47|nr:hypothetical protein [Pseudomonas coronafaciens]